MLQMSSLIKRLLKTLVFVISLHQVIIHRLEQAVKNRTGFSNNDLP